MSKTRHSNKAANSIYNKQATEIGTRIARLRNESQRDFVIRLQSGERDGATVDISKSHYHRFESGTHFMTIDVLIALCNYYHVSADFILFGKETSNSIVPHLSQIEAQTICDILNHIIGDIQQTSI